MDRPSATLLIEDPKLIPEFAPTLTPVHEETCPFKVSLYLLKNQIKHCVTNTLVPDSNTFEISRKTPLTLNPHTKDYIFRGL